MPKTIIDETVYNNAKKALLKLKSYGTTANKLKAVISAYDNGIKKYRMFVQRGGRSKFVTA